MDGATLSSRKESERFFRRFPSYLGMSRRLRFIPEGGALVDVTCLTDPGAQSGVAEIFKLFLLAGTFLGSTSESPSPPPTGWSPAGISRVPTKGRGWPWRRPAGRSASRNPHRPDRERQDRGKLDADGHAGAARADRSIRKARCLRRESRLNGSFRVSQVSPGYGGLSLRMTVHLWLRWFFSGYGGPP